MILLALFSQFANTLFAIAAAKYLANLNNKKLLLTLYFGSIICSEKNKQIDINKEENLGYKLLFDNYEFIDFDKTYINKNFKLLRNKVVHNIPYFELENNINYYLRYSYISFENFKRDRSFLKNEFKFLFDDKLNNELNNIIDLNYIKQSSIFHFRLNAYAYNELCETYYFKKHIFNNLLKENKRNIIVTDNVDNFNILIDKYNINKNLFTVLNSNSFIYDFIALMNCKQIYSISSTTFPLFAGFINNIPLCCIDENTNNDYRKYENMSNYKIYN